MVVTANNLDASNADKPMDFIPLPEAFENALKLPGIPQGYTSLITGWSNTGKSTIKNAIIASCINNGILPVIFETENNFDFQYAIDCGVKATPVYGEVEVEKVDEETGEIYAATENRIIDYTGDFIYFDNKTLAAQFGDNDYSSGKKTKTKRKEAVLEDIAYAMNTIMDMQDNGEIQQSICFIWDSIGSIGSFRSLSSKVGNNMFDAGAISSAFNGILNSRIPTSRKVSEPYFNTFVCVNKIWNDSMNSMGNIPSIELKGGKTFTYGARFIIHLGGAAKASTKKLTAIAKGETYNYGIISKIKVTKNQLPTPYNITYEGEIACVHNGLCIPEKIEEYKKVHMKEILEGIARRSDKALDITESDVSFSEEDGELDA
jgi:predicted heme/steroid binding protein